MSQHLFGVHPELIRRIAHLLDVMKLLGFPMGVTSGLRTDAQQEDLYAQGRTKPGKIVTWADGITSRSNHQAKADGYSYAIDCAFLIDIDGDGQIDDPDWNLKHPWKAYGENAKALGLRWGGDWSDKRRDLPHVELAV